MGWKPESGFLMYRWNGFDEALFLYLLGLGSPTHPLSKGSYGQWTSTYEWREIYGQGFLYSGPLFTHQISHPWIDFRGIQDDYMRGKGIDYFESSRRAALAQQRRRLGTGQGGAGTAVAVELASGFTVAHGCSPSKRGPCNQRPETGLVAQSKPELGQLLLDLI